MALSSVLSDTFEPELDLRDSSGKPIALTIDLNLFSSIFGLLEDQPVTTPNLDVPPTR